MITEDNLSSERHISKLYRTTHKMLSNIRVAFHYMDKDRMEKMITSMIIPKWFGHLT